MGHWGVKSYENDDADLALDNGFERVHGELYEELMDDRNPLSFDQIQKRLANDRTLAEAVKALEETIGTAVHGDPSAWDEAARLAFAGVVVRHAELGVAIPEPLRERAIAWLEGEEIDWDEETKRRLRREKEMAILRQGKPATPADKTIGHGS
jgi:hypothetical protein